MITLYTNATVYTGALTFTEAFAVQDDTFIFAGSAEEGAALDADQTVDLGGAFVCAGFNDSHMHLLSYGLSLSMAPLHEHTDSLKSLVACMKQFTKDHPVSPGQWIRGRGWNQDYFSDVQRLPLRSDLDEISTEHPVVITRCCGHCLVVNSKALEVCGITPNTAIPAGGAIGKTNGEPNGIFYDEAMNLIYEHIPAPDREQVKAMILLSCSSLNRYGVTSSQTDDYCAFESLSWQTINSIYRELAGEGKLTVRVCEQSNFSNLPSLKEFVRAGNTTGTGDPLFRIGPLKLIGDGSLGSRTAYLSRPYADDPSTDGLSIFTQEQLDEIIGWAHENEMQTAVHAIGDRSLDMVLDAIEKAVSAQPRTDHRHGIVHCQITRPDQLERIARLKLHVYAQSVFLDYDSRIVESRAGKELADSSYHWKSLMKKGVTVSNGTDCPVELPDALAGIQCAVTRAPLEGDAAPYLPEEAFTVQEALDSYTVCGARSSFEETVKGHIAPGFLADFVVLGDNPFSVRPSEIRNIPVLATYLGGRLVYSSKAS